MKHVVLSLLFVLSACDEPPPAVRPIAPTASRARVERAPELLDPGMRVRQSAEQAAAERERLGIGGGSSAPAAGGGGGGGGGTPGSPGAEPWPVPELAGDPTSRELEEFRAELAAEMERQIDPDHDPCMQLRDTASASATAVGRAVRGQERPPVAGRDAFRRGCRAMRPEMQQCLDRTYFQEHADECQQELARMSRAGERRSDEARDELAAIERGEAPGRANE